MVVEHHLKDVGRYKYLQDPDGVGGSSSLPPASDDNHVVSGTEETLSIANHTQIIQTNHQMTAGAPCSYKGSVP